jgi:hypothetical protein
MVAWLALGLLATACSQAQSPGASAAEAPGQACAIAYPDPGLSASGLAGADAPPEREGKEGAMGPATRSMVPPIDAAAPARTETATFALG